MLLPFKFQSTDALTPLGKLVAKAIAPKPADPIKAFEIGDHSIEPLLIGFDFGTGDTTVMYQYHFNSAGDYCVKEIKASDMYKPVVPAEPKKPQDGEWITHKPGPAPIGLGKLRVKFRDGYTSVGRAGEFFQLSWTHEDKNAGNHVVSYVELRK